MLKSQVAGSIESPDVEGSENGYNIRCSKN